MLMNADESMGLQNGHRRAVEVTLCIMLAWTLTGPAPAWEPGDPPRTDPRVRRDAWFDNYQGALRVSAIRVSLKNLKPIRSNLAGFQMGSSVTIARLGRIPWSPVHQALRDDPAGSAAALVRVLKASGQRALRAYDNYYWNTHSSREAFLFRRFLGEKMGGAKMPGMSPDEWARRAKHPTGKQLMDFCAAHGIGLSMVVETFYIGPDDKVYDTQSVIDNVDGVFDKAVERNAAFFARYYKAKGYRFPFVIEIGNEGIAWRPERRVSYEGYGKLARAYAEAVKAIAPEVQTAIVYRNSPDGKYNVLSAFKGAEKKLDHVVIHAYDHGWWTRRGCHTVSMTYTPALIAALEVVRSDLDRHNMRHVRILITEYAFDTWTAQCGSYGRMLDEACRELAMVANPRVSGMFIHSFPVRYLAAHSNGKRWLRLPGSRLLRAKQRLEGYDPYPPDRNPERGRRWLVLADGLFHRLLDRALIGNLYGFFYQGACGRVAGIVTGRPDAFNVLIVNNQEDKLRIQWPEGMKPSSARTVMILVNENGRGEWGDFARKGSPPFRIEKLDAPPASMRPLSVLLVEGIRGM